MFIQKSVDVDILFSSERLKKQLYASYVVSRLFSEVPCSLGRSINISSCRDLQYFLQLQILVCNSIQCRPIWLWNYNVWQTFYLYILYLYTYIIHIQSAVFVDLWILNLFRCVECIVVFWCITIFSPKAKSRFKYWKKKKIKTELMLVNAYSCL